MTAIVKIVAVLREKGPLSAEEIGKHVDSKNIAAMLGYYTGKGTLVKTGAGTDAVYDVSNDAPSAPPQTRKKPRKSAAGKKAARKTKHARKVKRKPKKSSRRTKRAAPPAARPVDAAQPFLAALTSELCIALVRNGQVEVLSRENTIALADLVLAHFEA